MSQDTRPRTEAVSFGTYYGGKINATDRGFEAFGPRDQYVATFPSMKSARKALFNLHQAVSSALAGGSAGESS